MNDRQDYDQFIDNQIPANQPPRVRKITGFYPDEIAQRVSDAIDYETLKEKQWEEMKARKPAPEYHSPVESHSEVDRRVNAAIADDPRTRRVGEELEQTTARRKEVHLADIEAQKAKKADSTATYERMIAHEYKTMGLEPSHRVRLPDWALAGGAS